MWVDQVYGRAGVLLGCTILDLHDKMDMSVKELCRKSGAEKELYIGIRNYHPIYNI